MLNWRVAVTVLAGAAAAWSLTPVPASMAAEEPTPSPSASPSSSGRGLPSPNCATYSIAVSPAAITAGDVVQVVVRIEGDGNGDHAVQLSVRGYTRRPEVVALTDADFTRAQGGGLPGPDGVRYARWTFSPTTSSRVWADYTDKCHDGQARHASTERALVEAAPRLTVDAQRHAPRDYTFRGQALSRPGQAVHLYRVGPDGREVLTARTTTTAAGTWSLRRKFLGSGEFRFFVRTTPDQANTAGLSNSRPTVIH